MKVFLGGTVPGYPWRKDLIKKLEEAGIEYFDPVVDDWDDAAYDEEERQKWTQCDVHLYIITPAQQGFYSLAEAVDSAWMTTQRNDIVTVYGFLKELDGEEFDERKVKSLIAIGKMIKRIGGLWMNTFHESDQPFEDLVDAFETYLQK